MDVKLDIVSGIYRPFRKPNDTPLYIHSESNHAPTMRKAIFPMVQKRLSSLSSNKQVFDEEKPIYEAALKKVVLSMTYNSLPLTTPKKQKEAAGVEK